MDAVAADAPAISRDARVDSAYAPDVIASDVGPSDAPAELRDAAPKYPCSELRHLADQGVLTKQRAHEVTFSPDGSWVVLRVQQDQLLRVALPSGEVATVSDSGGRAEALGQRGGLLVYGLDSDGNGLAVYEHGSLRRLAAGACHHVAAPDGSRVYVIRDCAGSTPSTLDVVDVASGVTTTLATNVIGRSYWTPDFSVSPNGDYFAFLVLRADGGERSSVLHIADRGGKVYAVSSQPGATSPYFATDELLLFGVDVADIPRPRGSLHAHVPGSGDTSIVLASEGRASGLFGYKVSPDKQWVLGASEPRADAGYSYSGLLYATRLDGTGEKLLSDHLMPYWANEMAIDAFAWSGDGSHAIYLDDRDFGIWARDPGEPDVERISPGVWFRAAPVGDRVALLENTGDVRQNRLRVTALGSGRDLFSFASDGSVGAPAFTPDGRGLLFLNTPAAGPQQLRYLSSSTPGSIVLAEWTQSQLDLYEDGPPGTYPVDPTGCFTIADTGLLPSPGTRLVLIPE